MFVIHGCLYRSSLLAALADRRNLIDNRGTKTLWGGGGGGKKGKRKSRMIHELAKLFGDQFC